MPPLTSHTTHFVISATEGLTLARRDQMELDAPLDPDYAGHTVLVQPDGLFTVLVMTKRADDDADD